MLSIPKPYGYQAVNSGWCRFFRAPPEYQIAYEGRLVQELTDMKEADVKRIVFLLNTAYSLGFADASARKFAE